MKKARTIALWTVTALLLAGGYWWATQRGGSEAAGREVAPDFSLPTLEPYREKWGETLELSDYVGKTPIVVNFWASWCPPCREEAPMLQKKWQEYQGQVQFIGVNFQDREEPALAFIEEFGLTFPSGADSRAEVSIDYRMLGLPETYFIDLEGNIAARHTGLINEEQFLGYLRPLLP